MTDTIKEKALTSNPNHTDTSRSGDLVELLRRKCIEVMCVERDAHCAEAADCIEALEAENERLREACHAIWQRGIERDPKWFGMSAADIARAALGEK